MNASDPPNYLNIPGHPGNTYGEMLASTFPNTRLIVLENGLGILTNAEEEQINFVVSSLFSPVIFKRITFNPLPSVGCFKDFLRTLIQMGHYTGHNCFHVHFDHYINLIVLPGRNDHSSGHDHCYFSLSQQLDIKTC